MRQQKILWIIVVLAGLILAFAFFYYRQVAFVTPLYLEGTGLVDRCLLEAGKEYVVCVAQDGKLVPYEPKDRTLSERELVLVKADVELLVKNRDREDRFNLNNQYQICSYTDLNPTSTSQFPQKYLSSLAYHDYLLPAGIFMYCSRPTLLTGNETAVIGQVPFGGAEKQFLLLGVRIFPATNFRNHRGFLDALNDSFNVIQVKYNPT